MKYFILEQSVIEKEMRSHTSSYEVRRRDNLLDKLEPHRNYAGDDSSRGEIIPTICPAGILRHPSD